MKNKRQVLQFLEDNACMINSLMSKKEQITFRGDVVSIITNDIKNHIMESKDISPFREEREEKGNESI